MTVIAAMGEQTACVLLHLVKAGILLHGHACAVVVSCCTACIA